MPIASTSLPDLAATPHGMPLATSTMTGLARSLLLPKSLVRPCRRRRAGSEAAADAPGRQTRPHDRAPRHCASFTRARWPHRASLGRYHASVWQPLSCCANQASPAGPRGWGGGRTREVDSRMAPAR